MTDMTAGDLRRGEWFVRISQGKPMTPHPDNPTPIIFEVVGKSGDYVDIFNVSDVQEEVFAIRADEPVQLA